MATGQKRDPRREAHWRAVLARQEQSGLNVRAFCRREGLAETALYAWRRTIRQRDQERQPARAGNAPPAAFVPLVVRPHKQAPPPMDDGIRIELRGGRVMRLPLSLPLERLLAIVGAMEGQPSMIEEAV